MRKRHTNIPEQEFVNTILAEFKNDALKTLRFEIEDAEIRGEVVKEALVIDTGLEVVLVWVPNEDNKDFITQVVYVSNKGDDSVIDDADKEYDMKADYEGEKLVELRKEFENASTSERHEIRDRIEDLRVQDVWSSQFESSYC